VLNALTEGRAYSLYKNGLPAQVSDLRKYDVAVWNSDAETIRVCDTRLTVYYENCAPSPDAPMTIEVLGGTVFQVLPAAAESLVKFKPGQIMTLLLTADGQVAGAMDSKIIRGNAVGIVSDTGKIQMPCGNEVIELGVTASAECHGKVVQVASGQTDVTKFSLLYNQLSADLDVINRKLGSKTLAQNVMAFVGGERTSLWELNQSMIGKAEIIYARSNWNGQVDLIVLRGDTAAGAVYGRAEVSYENVDNGPVQTAARSSACMTASAQAAAVLLSCQLWRNRHEIHSCS